MGDFAKGTEMLLNKGDTVIYQGKEYVIIWIYDSEFYEIKNIMSNKIELVHMSEIMKNSSS